MAKEEITGDMWLHILSKTVANFKAAGGRVGVVDEFGAVGIYLYELAPDDERLHPDFQALVDAHYRCLDCGVDTDEIGEDYMVFDELWEAGGGGEGRLCVGCLEKRLGRELGPGDFTHVFTNVWTDEDEEKSERLVSRLTGKETRNDE